MGMDNKYREALIAQEDWLDAVGSPNEVPLRDVYLAKLAAFSPREVWAFIKETL